MVTFIAKRLFDKKLDFRLTFRPIKTDFWFNALGCLKTLLAAENELSLDKECKAYGLNDPSRSDLTKCKEGFTFLSLCEASLFTAGTSKKSRGYPDGI